MPGADKAGVVQLNVAFLLSSAKLATSLRMMGLAERNLKRDEEAEETLVSAISVFKGSRIKTCLQKLYAEADDTMDAGESPFAPSQIAPLLYIPIVVYSACVLHPLILHDHIAASPPPPLGPPPPPPKSPSL